MIMTPITTYVLRPVEQQDLPVFAGWIRALGRQNDPGDGDLEGHLLLELQDSVRLDYPQQFLVLEQDNPILHITVMGLPGKGGRIEKIPEKLSALVPGEKSGPVRRLYTLINPACDEQEYWLYALQKTQAFFAEQEYKCTTRIRLNEPASQQEAALQQMGFRPCPQQGWYEGTVL